MSTGSRVESFPDLRGGQNAADPPHLLGETQCTSATNVEWYRAGVGRKRRGSRKVERDAGSAFPTTRQFTTIATAETLLGRTVIVEWNDLSSWGDWGRTATPNFNGSFGPPDTQAGFACVVVFNNKYFMAYDSAVDRLHYYNTNITGGGYRAGLAAPSTPTITESAGAVTDNRKYRAVVYNSTTGERSEPSTETGVRTLVAEQASAAAPGAAPIEENYNRWELQVASDDDNYATWWVLGNAAFNVAIVDNNATAVAASGYEPAPELGLYSLPHSCIHLGVDDNRLLMAGAYEATSSAYGHPGRVWFTPVIGDRGSVTQVGADDQRIVATATVEHWVDLDAGDQGGDVTGFAPPVLGWALAFKRSQIWKLQRLGSYEKPYQPIRIDSTYGTFGYRTIQPGVDAQGRACVYFASSRGPCRIGANGTEYLGVAVEDIWARVNQFGNRHVSQHATFYPDKGQYWLWVSVDGGTTPSVLLVYSVRTDGWATYSGVIASALCSALLPRYVNDTNKGITTTAALTAPFVPYAGIATNGLLVECDAINPSTGVALDTDAETWSSGSTWNDGTTYAAGVTTAPIRKGLTSRMTLDGAMLLADAASGVSVTLAVIPDYDTTKAVSGTVSLAPAGSETRVLVESTSVQAARAKALQLFVGDAAAVANQWTIHALQARVHDEADR